jgi:ribonuclease VapC
VIIVDTSALFAILTEEAEAALFTDVIDEAEAAACSAVSYAELGIVATRRFGADMRSVVEALISRLVIEVTPVDAPAAVNAVAAYAAFGRGFHPARLNICDCFAYALAKTRGAPLLFKGDDFAKTDLVPAWRPSA